MRVHVVSDVHGNAEALARAGAGADALIVLGDLLDFVDYHDHSRGILGTMFGAQKVAQFSELRRSGRPGDAGAYIRSLWAGVRNPAALVEEAVHEQYARLFAAMTTPTFATPGNVDVPHLWPKFAHDGVKMLDGETVEFGGLRFGFVGGAVLPPGATLRPNAVWTPYLRTEEEFAAATALVRGVDVLCSHIPPAVAELVYDVVARRPEIGSPDLLDLVRLDTPRWSLFGHIHQPLAARIRIGRTECVNVGYFRRSGTPYVLRW